MEATKNVPFTKQQVEELPKGFHPSVLPNRQFMKQFASGKLQFTMVGGQIILTVNYPPNCRKLSHSNSGEARRRSGSFRIKQKKYGRVN